MLQRMFICLLLSLILSACSMADAGNSRAPTEPGLDNGHSNRHSTPHFVEGEVLVQFKPGTRPVVIDGLIKQHNLTVIKAINTKGLFLMRITDKTPVVSLIKKLKNEKSVLFAEPNYIVSAD